MDALTKALREKDVRQAFLDGLTESLSTEKYHWIVRIEGGRLSGYASETTTSELDPAQAIQNALRRLEGVDRSWLHGLWSITVERVR